jgi:3',5'-cyclic AMP phosphodiesterase CpdA
MKLSLLHISDLHRDPANPIGNAALLDSLQNDRRRYTGEETPSIRSPDLVVVSGDIVQGVMPGVADPDSRLSSQPKPLVAYIKSSRKPSKVLLATSNATKKRYLM